MTKQRGRPKLYDATSALEAAATVFWNKGFSGTSLDDLSAAMDMNRPSIYRAFGDKESIYRQALDQFASHMEEGFRRTLLHEPDIRVGLKKFYREALEIYTSGDSALGCMVMCTAPAAAVSHPEVQADLLAVIQEIDAKLFMRVEKAMADGQVNKTQDAKLLGKLIQAVLHTLAIRARAGESKASLRKFADSATLMLFA
jgi:AcrR family transcriptional regulator